MDATDVTLDLSFNETYTFESLALWNKGTLPNGGEGSTLYEQILNFELFSTEYENQPET